MGLFSFGNRRKPKPFGFIPRFYDQQKEELQARLARYDKEKDNAELMKARIKAGFKQNSPMYGSSPRTKLERKSNIRLLVIIVVLTGLSYLILKSEAIGNFLATF